MRLLPSITRRGSTLWAPAGPPRSTVESSKQALTSQRRTPSQRPVGSASEPWIYQSPGWRTGPAGRPRHQRGTGPNTRPLCPS
eukprot:3570992-Alexandrium_andersonii.AAC.1